MEFWTALADLAGRRKQETKALEILDEAEKTMHDCVELRVSRAASPGGGPDEGNLAALDELVKKDRSGFSPEDQEKLLSGLAEAQMRAGRTAEATTLLEELARTPGHRTDLRLRLTLFDLAVKRDDGPAVDKVLAEIHEVEGGAGAYYGLGQALRSIYLARKNPKEAKDDLDEAWQALDRAADLQPNWSAVELARADVAELGGDPEGMIQHLKEAVHLEQGPGQRVGHPAPGRSAEPAAATPKPRTTSASCGSRCWSIRLLGRLAANVALNLNWTTRKRRRRPWTPRLPEGTKDFRDLLLRARFHEAMHQDKAAEEDYRKATEAAPKQPAVWVAYVQFLGNHDKSGTAVSLIKSDVDAQGGEGPRRSGRGPVLRGAGHEQGSQRTLTTPP